MTKHQGDITFTPVCSMPKGKKEKHDGSFILARGEATGHSHRITVADPKKLTLIRLPDGRAFMKLEETGTVTHEEHMDIVLAPGIYEIGHEREYDHFADAVVKVQD
ncbi:MAG: hypothetical protein WC763_05100 [Candidatus Paceibacterota bacterium]